MQGSGAVTGQEEIPHVQGQRNPSKIVGAEGIEDRQTETKVIEN